MRVKADGSSLRVLYYDDDNEREIVRLTCPVESPVW